MDTSRDKSLMLTEQIMQVTVGRSLSGSEYNRKFEEVHRIVGQARLADARAHYDTAKGAVEIETGDLRRQLAAANERAGRLEKALSEIMSIPMASEYAGYPEKAAYHDGINVTLDRVRDIARASLEVPDAL